MLLLSVNAQAEFCKLLSQRLGGSVISLENDMPLFQDASLAQKLEWFWSNVKRYKWPRILVDFPRSRHELQALEHTVEEPRPRALLAFQIPKGSVTETHRDRQCPSSSLRHDGRLVRLPMDMRETASLHCSTSVPALGPAGSSSSLRVKPR